ncbi:MAG: hypothetical protein A2270_09470 [Elusimicrobia bacterium RIFOXYA12_FULL_51_18]|nr:MAG: hypothetical protein A2270_09470 [Elusimicrobia bacterium RIFOXYA12_FULL_51_18]OGS32730.1 MAG: hypothetical protein A2218_11785 [Elusimicrobia bacterium RIFOXYA2_FULL_53_38]
MPYLCDILKNPVPTGSGAKAEGIRALHAAGFAVPSSWVVLPSDVEMLFSGRDALKTAGIFLTEADRTLGSSFPVIVRSSATREDLPGAAAPGIYLSKTARNLRELATATIQCAASARGAAAKAYGNALARKGLGGPRPACGDMALLIQPLIKAEFGAVCTLYHKQELVVELARGGAASITSGAGARWRAVFSPEGRPQGRLVPDFPWKDALAAAASAAKIQRTLYPSSNISVEMALCGGHPVILQARVFGTVSGAGMIDFDMIFASIRDLMRGLGFSNGEWALSEIPALLAYNYLRLSRPESETLEHFVINLRPAGLRRAQRLKWITVRHLGDQTLFPPKSNAKAQKTLFALARQGLLFIFRAALPGNRVKRVTLGGGRGTVPFSFVLSSMTGCEAAYIRRRLTPEGAAAMCERLDREKDLLRAVFKKLRAGKKTAYARALEKGLLTQLAQLGKQRSVAASLRPAHGGGYAIKGIPTRRENRTIDGLAVTDRDILRQCPRKFIYAAADFEPSFLSRIGRVAAVAISRGTIGSHAAAICAEFGVPLLVETNNISRIRTGDRLRLSLLTGKIILLSRPHLIK